MCMETRKIYPWKQIFKARIKLENRSQFILSIKKNYNTLIIPGFFCRIQLKFFDVKYRRMNQKMINLLLFVAWQRRDKKKVELRNCVASLKKEMKKLVTFTEYLCRYGPRNLVNRFGAFARREWQKVWRISPSRKWENDRNNFRLNRTRHYYFFLP